MTETTSPAPPSVDDMAESITKKLEADREHRATLVSDRERLTVRIKALDVEIDKAERMTKALIPRHRNSSSKAAD